MNSSNPALLVNLLGFAVGISLYGLLAMMVVRHRKSAEPANTNLLLLATAFLGMLWNVSELFVFVAKDFASDVSFPLITAASYAALGFLPSVVVHSAQEMPKSRWLTVCAYVLSTVAAILHFRLVFSGDSGPSERALQALTFGSLSLAAALLIVNFKQTLQKKTVWATALLIFAASAFHLSGDREGYSWFVELFAHQSSLPLALVILYQNFRFAFADLFLKRSISLMLLTLSASALYIWVATPLLRYHETHDRNDAQAIGVILALWVGTALMYPSLHRLAVWLVDRIILHRIDYAAFQNTFTRKLDTIESVDGVLDMLRDELAAALTSTGARWERRAALTSVDSPPRVAVSTRSFDLPTVEVPSFRLFFGEFQGGRQLLSEEIRMVETLTLLSARRIDAIRVTNARFQREFSEKEISKLAAEARLAALRAQINPHFLFNALTTIGYLIETAPDKAFKTLLQLTRLLRSVLGSTSEFSTLGEEIKLIESYLDIERARFEKRLSVDIDIPRSLEKVRIPTLILQPLVENAIKHGIAENRNGGEVRIAAAGGRNGTGTFVKLIVADSGRGDADNSVQPGAGVGLANVRERLELYYGGEAEFRITTDAKTGTCAEICLPNSKMDWKVPEPEPILK